MLGPRRGDQLYHVHTLLIICSRLRNTGDEDEDVSSRLNVSQGVRAEKREKVAIIESIEAGLVLFVCVRPDPTVKVYRFSFH